MKYTKTFTWNGLEVEYNRYADDDSPESGMIELTGNGIEVVDEEAFDRHLMEHGYADEYDAAANLGAILVGFNGYDEGIRNALGWDVQFCALRNAAARCLATENNIDLMESIGEAEGCL